MKFKWSINEVAKKTITIYSSNLTLNKAACRHFETTQFVLLGLDEDKNLLGIKPVEKQQIDENLYLEEQLHRISIGKSYGRVSNKVFIDDISEKYNLDLSNSQGIKYDATFDVVHQVLLVNLCEEMNEIIIGTKKHGYHVDGEAQVLKIFQLYSVYEKIKGKEKEFIIPFNEIQYIKVTYSSYDATVWGVNCALVLEVTTTNDEKIPFHGVIEASKTGFLKAIEILEKYDIKLVDDFDLINKMKASQTDRIDYVIHDFITSRKT